MLIGAMNHPAADVLSEIEWMAEMGMEFLDLTLEPPAAACCRVDGAAVRRALDRHHMAIVGHTAFYLPLANAFEKIRRAAVDELKECLKVFCAAGARWMNLHPDRYTPMHDRRYFMERDLLSLRELGAEARRCGIGLMVENLPGDFNSARQLGDLLDPMPDLGLHLDIGHANLLVPQNTTEEILMAYGNRLRHVHLHDNKGGHEDMHLPLGAGTMDIRKHLRTLKSGGYDGTITLEVFTPDRHYLDYSRQMLRRMWDEA